MHNCKCTTQKCMRSKTYGNRNACQAGRRDPFPHRRAAALPQAESRTAFDSQTRHYGSPESRHTETAGAIQICAFSFFFRKLNRSRNKKISSPILSGQVDCVLSGMNAFPQPASTGVIFSPSLFLSCLSVLMFSAFYEGPSVSCISLN